MGFVPPPYPHDRLRDLREVAEGLPGGLVDLSIGTPVDPPPPEVVEALGTSGTERGYPASIGSLEFRRAAAGWVDRTFGVHLDVEQVAACVGTKELVVGLPHWLSLRTPERDTVLYPALSYPSYEMGAILAGLRAVPVPVDESFRIDMDAVDQQDAERALCLWVNTPGNPAGGLDDLGAAARWGRAHGVPVLSDECYAAFTWDGSARTILSHGTEGVLALHSLSKRSNLAGVRAGFYAGDAELVHYLSEVRKHAGLMVPGPVQTAAIVAWADEEHVEAQRRLYRARLEHFSEVLAKAGLEVALPAGAFYLWVPAPSADGWELARWLATEGGVLASPGDLYGEAGRAFVRLAMVQPIDRLDLVASRLG